MKCNWVDEVFLYDIENKEIGYSKWYCTTCNKVSVELTASGKPSLCVKSTSKFEKYEDECSRYSNLEVNSK